MQDRSWNRLNLEYAATKKLENEILAVFDEVICFFLVLIFEEVDVTFLHFSIEVIYGDFMPIFFCCMYIVYEFIQVNFIIREVNA